MKLAIAIAMVLCLTSCASILNKVEDQTLNAPDLVPSTPYKSVAPKNGDKVYVAVYGYSDLTGQRSSAVQSLSSAVTQGGENYLINALRDYSNGEWFRVVERKNIDHVIRERQIVRSSRIQVDAKADPLPPMVYAGVIIDGGIIGYDSNVTSGGNGMRVFGLGAAAKYKTHIVTTALRVISVTTSEILLSVVVEKHIISHSSNTTGVKFFDLDQQVFEMEMGMNMNEAPNYAVRRAIEQAVHDVVQQGISKKIW
tara:strand:- start:15518 stop:16279 length:762 start_codon:yes stop_codon:yes gene_type:complete